MSTKFSTEVLNSQNLKQRIKNTHSKSKSNPFTHSQKRIAQQNFKSPSKKQGQTQTIASSNGVASVNGKKRKLSIKQNNTSQFLGFQNFKDNDQFLELYNQDPIFRYKVQFLMTQSEKKLKKNPSISILKRKTHADSQQIFEEFSPQQSALRATLKSKRSLNDMILLQHCQCYKEMIQKCHSEHQTCYSSKNE